MTTTAPTSALTSLLDRGRAAHAAGDYKNALTAYLEALVTAPDNITVQQELLEVLAHSKGYRLPRAITDHLAMAAPGNKLDIQSLATLLSNQMEGNPDVDAVLSLFDSAAPGLPDLAAAGDVLAPILNDRLFLLVLDRVTAISPTAERLIIHLRRHALGAQLGKAAATLWQQYPAALAAIANQCFNTEYIFGVSAAELEDIATLQEHIARTGAEMPENCIVLAMYMPLLPALQACGAEVLDGAQAAAPDWPGWAQQVWSTQVEAPALEAAFRDAMPQLTPIDNALSALIGDQYEAFPYPRWQTVSAAEQAVTLRAMMAQHLPAGVAPSIPDGPADILFAGCGTGKQVVEMAHAVDSKNILAIDLSRTSLAHAFRKAQEFGIDNAHFGQADIMQVKDWDARFDLIVCTGVLHHMADPSAALASLVALSKPHTVFLLALYSERARPHVIAARELIEQEDLPDTLEGIRAFRARVRALEPDHPVARVAESREFYSASGLHDLAFNRHELRFTPPQVGELLAENGLTFAGFHIKRAEHKALYRAQFPDDPAMTNLENWDRLEQSTPDLFRNMMQFWCVRAA
jgi:SAM-dependent methyltransferase